MLKKFAIALIALALPFTVSAATILGIQQGGTASSTLTGILVGNLLGPVQSLKIGTGLTFTSGTLSATGGGSFPFTPTSYGVSTSTTIGFTNGILSTASSTFSSSVNFNGTTNINSTFNVAGSIFDGGIHGITLIPTGTSTIGTAGNGINITNGCFAVNSICISGATGSSASSTLLTDNNTFSGTNVFSTNSLTLKAGFISQASSTVTGLLTLATTTTGEINGVITVNGLLYPQTSAGINSALSQCGTNGINGVYLPGGAYTINSRITPVSNCHIYGDGKGVTNLNGSVSSDWDFFYNSSTQLVNFTLSDLTINLQNGSNASGIELSNASSTVIQNVSFLNGAAGGWFIQYGANGSGLTAPVQNYNNSLINDDFTSHAGTLEAVLVYNAENTHIERMSFTNISSPGLGLWQKDYDTKIDNFYCNNSTNGSIYYSLTTDRTTIDSPNFNNCGGGIKGANVSDNGSFAVTQAQGLKITNPVMVGGTDTTQASGIQLGAVNDATIINPIIKAYQIGIILNGGNESASSSPTNWSIIGGSISDNNASDDAFGIHPGILISTSTPSGLQEGGLIQGVDIYDDQASPTQKFPIVFDGATTYDGVTVTCNKLSAPASLSGTSIGLQDSAVLGSNILVFCNQQYSGTNPSQTQLSGPWSLNGSNIYNNNAGNVGIGTTTPTAGFAADLFAGDAVLHVSDLFTNNSITKLLVDNDWNAAGGYGFEVRGRSNFPQLLVDGTGFVGVGTSTPQSPLAVSGGVTVGSDYDIAAPTNGLIVENRFGVASTSPDSGAVFENYTGRALVHIGDPTNNSQTKLLIENGWTGSGGFGLVVQKNNATTPEFTVDGNGNVGIGTSTAGSILSIGTTGAGINFTTSTTTFGNVGGINLTTGCFSINGTCMTANLGTVTAVNATYPLASSGGTTPIISSATSSASSAGVLSAADWTTFNGKLSGNQTITLSGDVTGSGATAITAAFNLSNTHWWTATQNFTNASTSEFTATSTIWLTSLATPAGTILAVDPTGKVIATTTSAGGVTSVNGTTNQITSSGGTTPTLSLPTLVIFPSAASSTNLSVFANAYFGGSATSTFSSAGALTVPTAITTINTGTQLNMQQGSANLDETNGFVDFKTGFTGKSFQLKDSSSNNQDTFFFDNGGLSLGGSFANTTAPSGGLIVQGTTGIATSTPGTLLSLGVSGNASGINFSLATSTFENAGGINLTTGCFSINNVCVGGSTGTSLGYTAWGGSIATTFGTTTIASTTPFWAQGGIFASSTSATPTLAVTQSGTGAAAIFTGGNVGIATTSPYTLLDIQSSKTGDDTPAFVIDGSATANGNADLALTRATGGTGEANIDFNNGGTNVWQLGIQNTGLNTGDFELWDGLNNPIFTIQRSTNNVSFGTTTPAANDFVTIATSSEPQFTLGDGTANLMSDFRNVGNMLYVATSAPFLNNGATSTTNLMFFNETTGALTLPENATTTAADGINLTAGCITYNGGACIGSGSGVTGGTTGMLAAFTSASTLTATSGPTFQYFTATSSSATSTVAGSLQVGTTTGTANFVLNGTISDGPNILQIATSSNQNIFDINRNGLVLIGTSTPGFGALTIGSANGPQAVFSDNAPGDNIWSIRNYGGNFALATSTASATSTTSVFSFNAASYLWQFLSSLAVQITSTTALVVKDGFGSPVLTVNTASTSGPIFAVQATSSADTLFSVDQYGHLTASSTKATPSISSCGTGSPAMSANANDVAGSFVTGTSASSCTITFGSVYSATPIVVVSDSNTSAVVDVSSVSTTAFTISLASALSAVTVNYIVVMP